MMSTAKFTAVLVGSILAFVVLIVIGVRQFGHHYDVADCRQFALASERTTKFVDYTFMTWGCLTPTADGRWIDVSKLREVGAAQ